jgi:hypothetical protein
VQVSLLGKEVSMRKKLGWLRAFTVLCLCAAAASVTSAANANKELQEALEAKYELAKTGIDHMRITHPGTVLVIQKDGIYASPSTDMGTQTTKVVDGNVEEPKGFGAAFFSNPTNRSLKKGETVYITRIGVRSKDVRFLLITCDTSDVNVRGNTLQTRYAATIAFEFPQGFLETADASAVKKAVDAVLLPEAEVQAASTKTVQLGQTPDEVKSALGAPDKVVKLGPKEIFVYKDMKVVFVDGKVADVQ